MSSNADVAHSTTRVAKGYWHWQLLLPSMDRFGTDDELEAPPPVGGVPPRLARQLSQLARS